MEKTPLNIKTLYKHFASHPESAWIMIWPNALQLYKFVKDHDIKKVLDLGTGIGLSAAVVALAMLEKGEKDYEIHSVEQFQKCVDLASKLIPKELQTNLTLHKANVKAWETPEMPYNYYSVYDVLPEGEFDLIINDGPGPFLEGDNFIDLPNGTVHQLLLADAIKPGTFIIYDGRMASLKSIERYFGHNFYLHPQTQRGDFNVIERKDNKVECLDEKTPMMAQLGYFKDAAK